MLRTQGGHPEILVSRVGAGRHIHVPFILSHKINQQPFAALGVFRCIMEQIRPVLRPAIPVMSKATLADVSTLLDEQNRPALIGITNYEQTAAAVRVQWHTLPRQIEGSPHATAALGNGTLTLTVPARQAAAFFIDT